MAKEKGTMLMHTINLACFIAGALSWLMICGLAVNVLVTIYKKTLKYETTTDFATIIWKEVEDNTMFTPDYLVYMLYQGKEYCLNDEDLYKGEMVQVPVKVHKGYDRNHNMRNMYLTTKR